MLFKRLRPRPCCDEALFASSLFEPRRESKKTGDELGACPTSPGTSRSAEGYGMRPFAGDGGGRADTMLTVGDVASGDAYYSRQLVVCVEGEWTRKKR